MLNIAIIAVPAKNSEDPKVLSTALAPVSLTMAK